MPIPNELDEIYYCDSLAYEKPEDSKHKPNVFSLISISDMIYITNCIICVYPTFSMISVYFPAYFIRLLRGLNTHWKR